MMSHIGATRAILITTAAVAAMAALDAAPPAAPGQYLAFVGPYTRPNQSKGIYAYKYDAKTGKFTPIGLAAETSNPSFLAVHPNHKFLYAVNENAQGTVSAFVIDAATGRLQALNQVSSKGNGPCHLAVDPGGKWLFVANYNSGSVAAFPVNADGSLGEAASFVQHSGSSVDAQRQKGPHAHETVLSPDAKVLFVPDLGMDQVMAYRFDAQGALTPAGNVSTLGKTPRHFTIDPSGNFLVVENQDSGNIVIFKIDPKTGGLAPTGDALEVSQPVCLVFAPAQ